MAKLTVGAREEEHAEVMREIDEDTALLKHQWGRLVAAADDWLDDNFAAFNASLPAPIRNTATRREKMRAMRRVINRRFRERA